MKKAIGIFVVLVLAAVITTIANPQFAESGNLENVLYRTALYGIISIGVSFVIVTGGIDLSIGSVIALTGCLLPIILTPRYETAKPEQQVLQVDVDGNRVELPGDSPPLRRDDRIFFLATLKTTSQGKFTVAAPPRQDEAGRLVIQVEQSLAPITQQAQSETGRRTVLIAGEPAKIADVPQADRHEVLAIEPRDRRITLAAAGPTLAVGDRVTLLAEIEFTQERRYNVAEASRRQASRTIVAVQELPQELKPGMRVTVEKVRHLSIPIAILMVLAVAAAIGLVHGLLITKLRLQPFVVTLCGLLFYRGLARFITNDTTQGFGSLFGGLRMFAEAKACHVPVPMLRWVSGEAGDAWLGTAWVGIHVRVVFLALLAVAAIVVLSYTVFGRYLQALGRNVEAARLSGINTDRMIIAAYVICALLSGVAGSLFVLEYNTVAPSSSGGFYELWAIAAAVLGGCSLRGGEASVLGVIVGAAVMQVLSNAILLTRTPQTLEYCVIAVVILTGVIIDELLRRFTARRRARHEAVLAEREAAPKPSP